MDTRILTETQTLMHMESHIPTGTRMCAQTLKFARLNSDLHTRD